MNSARKARIAAATSTIRHTFLARVPGTESRLTGLVCLPVPQHAEKRRFFTIVAGKIKKLAGGAAGAGRRWRRRWRSQTQSPTAQEANFEGRGEREGITGSLRQCVVRDHQIRSGMIGSGLFIHCINAPLHRSKRRAGAQASQAHKAGPQMLAQ